MLYFFELLLCVPYDGKHKNAGWSEGPSVAVNKISFFSILFTHCSFPAQIPLPSPLSLHFSHHSIIVVIIIIIIIIVPFTITLEWRRIEVVFPLSHRWSLIRAMRSEGTQAFFDFISVSLKFDGRYNTSDWSACLKIHLWCILDNFTTIILWDKTIYGHILVIHYVTAPRLVACRTFACSITWI